MVPPLTQKILYQPEAARGIQVYGAGRPRPTVRPAYTDESLAKALREGVDPTGRPLAAPMPRYALTDSDMAALIAYLKTLSASTSPGDDGKTMHLATIVTEGVAPERRKALLDILQAYAHDWNADIRHQTERGKFTLDTMYESYRHWDLHVWELKGPRGTWASQLDKYYREQPVFAVLSGIGNGSWRPIHQFCEQMELPCLYPVTDEPPVTESDFYSIYFSKGPATEAEVLAKHLKDKGVSQSARIVQVFRSDDVGTATAAAFRKAMEAEGFGNVKDRSLRPQDRIPPGFWSGLMEQEQPVVMALWLDPDAWQSVGGQKLGAKALQSVFVSGSLQGGRPIAVPEALRDKLFLLYPYDLPENRTKRLARMQAWLRMKKIAPGNDLDQARAYFAVLSVSESIKHMLDNHYRDYLVERLENMANSPMPSPFPRLSLGTGQRYASKGAYVLQVAAGGKLKPVSDWIVP